MKTIAALTIAALTIITINPAAADQQQETCQVLEETRSAMVELHHALAMSRFNLMIPTSRIIRRTPRQIKWISYLGLRHSSLSGALTKDEADFDAGSCEADLLGWYQSSLAESERIIEEARQWFFMPGPAEAALMRELKDRRDWLFCRIQEQEEFLATCSHLREVQEE